VSSAKLGRWGGFAAILGGVLEIVVAGLSRPGPPSLTFAGQATYETAILMSVAGGPLFAAGLVGLYAGLAGGTGRSRFAKGLGMAGLILAGLAALAPLAFLLQVMTIGTVVPAHSLFVSAVFFLGLWGLPLATMLLGVVALRSRALGYWKALPLVLGVSMVLEVPYMVLGFGWLLLGYVLWSSQTGKVSQPTHAH